MPYVLRFCCFSVSSMFCHVHQLLLRAPHLAMSLLVYILRDHFHCTTLAFISLILHFTPQNLLLTLVWHMYQLYFIQEPNISRKSITLGPLQLLHTHQSFFLQQPSVLLDNSLQLLFSDLHFVYICKLHICWIPSVWIQALVLIIYLARTSWFHSFGKSLIR